jgi:hypothetical protein
MAWPFRSGRDQDRAEIVDVGEGGAGHDLPADLRRRSYGRRFADSAWLRVDPGARALASVSGPIKRARDLRRAIHAIGVAGDGVDPARRPARWQRQRVFRVRTADAVAAPRDGQLSARQDHARPLGRQRAGGMVAGDVPRLAFDRVAENVDGIALRLGQAAAARSDWDGAATITFSTLSRLGSSGRTGIAAGLEEGPDRGRRGRRPSGAARQRPRRVAGNAHRRAAGDIARIVAGHIRNQQRQHPRRIGRDRKPPALDRRDFLADAVDLPDRRARGQQRLGQRLFLGQRDPVRRAGSAAPSPRRRSARARNPPARRSPATPASAPWRDARSVGYRDAPPRRSRSPCRAARSRSA